MHEPRRTSERCEAPEWTPERCAIVGMSYGPVVKAPGCSELRESVHHCASQNDLPEAASLRMDQVYLSAGVTPTDLPSYSAPSKSARIAAPPRTSSAATFPRHSFQDSLA